MLRHSAISSTKALLRHGIQHQSLATTSPWVRFPISIGVPSMLLVLLALSSIISLQQCTSYLSSKSSVSSQQQSPAISPFPSRYSLQSYARFLLHALNGLVVRHSIASLVTLSNDMIDFSARLASSTVSNSQLRSLRTRT